MGRNTRIKAIEGFEDYFITDHGEVYSNKSGVMHKMKPAKDSRGYLSIPLRKNKAAYTQRVHRLVAEAFIDNLLGKEYINHKDGVKKNNRYTNLEWVTKSENTLHAYRLGLRDKRGSKNGRATVTEDDIHTIREYIKKGLRHQGIANIFVVSKQTIDRIARRETWKHVK